MKLILKELTKAKSKKILFYGASLQLKEILKKREINLNNVIGIIDINPELTNTTFENLKIYSLADLKILNADYLFLTITNNHKSIYNKLKQYISDNNINIKLLKDVFYTYKSSKKYYCPVCDKKDFFIDFNNRSEIKCPNCDSLERHRFLFFIYNMLFLSQKNKTIKLLHMAPEKSFYKLFKSNKYIDYTCMDINPTNYIFAPDCKQENVLNMSFKSEDFDYIISNHVLEHIENEESFFNEVFRVLKPNGTLILSVPYCTNLEKTYENSTIKTPEERTIHFGQHDHVRKYGCDLQERFEQYGKIIPIKHTLTSKLEKEMRLDSQEIVLLIQKK